MRFSFLFYPYFFVVIFLCIGNSYAKGLERLDYQRGDLIVDLGVGLWAWPLPMDYDGDGLTDLVVVSTGTPAKGTYFFKNTGEIDTETKLPIFLPGQRIGDAVDNSTISYIDGKPVVMTPGKIYPDFKQSVFAKPVKLATPSAAQILPKNGRIRANQWSMVNYYNRNQMTDLVVGLGYWGDYGWDDAYDLTGQWTQGPLRGLLYLLPNQGTQEKPRYGEAVPLKTSHGEAIEVFGRPSPNFADFRGTGKLDLICGSFIDGFTYFQNIGTRSQPIYAPGRPLTNGDKRIRMNLCMITPVAYDFTGNGFPDLIVGDEDGRVALVENTGKVVDGMPVFLPPRYFRQKAEEVKFGVLSTPYGVDWNGDGKEDIIVGNSAGEIAFIENLGGNPVKWGAPQLLQADGETIRIIAGSNGSIQGPAEEKWGYTTLTVADWDGDGLPDIMINSIWGKIEWYKNIGTRSAPKLAAAQPVELEWSGLTPKPAWNWWYPQGKELVTQWRTTPVMIDWDGDGLMDLIVLDHEGYLAFFRREKRGEKLVLLPGKRIFRMEGETQPLNLAKGRAGKSGRRKLAIFDIDGDGRPDLLLNGKNATFYRNLGVKDGITVFRDLGNIDSLRLAGHTTSPTMLDLSGNGDPGILIGAEDGRFYYQANPYTQEPELKIETDSLLIEASHVFEGRLADGQKAFANRRYVWKKVPKPFANWKTIGTYGGEQSFIRVTAKRNVVLHLATSKKGDEINLDGWEVVNQGEFFYTAKNDTEMSIYKRSLRGNETIYIPQGDWTGGTLLLPTN